MPRSSLLVVLSLAACGPRAASTPAPAPALPPTAHATIVAAATATPSTTSVVVLVDGARVFEHYADGVDAATHADGVDDRSCQAIRGRVREFLQPFPAPGL